MTDPFEIEPTQVTPTVTAKKRSPLDVVLIGAAVVALAGVAFASGRLTAPATAAANTTGNTAQGAGGNGFRQRGSFDPNASFVPGQGGFGGAFGGAGGAGAGVTINGKVVNVTATQITVQLANGTTVNIPVDSSTAYHTQTSATSSDVQTGSTVQVEVTGGLGGGGNRGPNASAAPAASGAPRTLGTASSITIIP